MLSILVYFNMFSAKDTGKDEPTVKDTPVKKANETTPADIALAGLVESCNEEEAKYQKLYLEYGLVLSKEDIDRNGQKQVRGLVIEFVMNLTKLDEDFSEGTDAQSTGCRTTLFAKSLDFDSEKPE